MPNTLTQTIAQNTPAYLQELAEFINIPSISTDPAYKADVETCAKWVAATLTKLNASDVIIHPTSSHPVVTAQIGHNPAKPTVLVYGHYDVQPVGNMAEWHSPPFDLTERNGKIFARGATDDKGQVFCYFKAIELLQAKNAELPCNIKFLIEGAEEIGSAGLADFMAANPALTVCDVAVVSDTSIIDEATPAITAGLRGNVVLQVRYNGPNKELHSGFFGGAITNPIEALCKKIAAVTNAQGQITLANFYDDVRTYTPAERALFNQQPNFEKDVMLETGVAALQGEVGFTALEHIGIRPCFSVMSLHAGPDLGLVKGVIPPFAEAMVGLRLVPGQNPTTIAKVFEQHFANNLPAGITASIILHGASTAWGMASFESKGYKAAQTAYAKSFGKPPLPIFCGGSIPIVAALAKAGANPVLMGFGLGSDNLHSPNEHMSINRLQKGIETLVWFFEAFGEA